jgi:hypothetical protein
MVAGGRRDTERKVAKAYRDDDRSDRELTVQFILNELAIVLHTASPMIVS